MNVPTSEIEKATARRLGMTHQQVANVMQTYADEWVKANKPSVQPSVRPDTAQATPAKAAKVENETDKKAPPAKAPTKAAAAKKALAEKAGQAAKKITPKKNGESSQENAEASNENKEGVSQPESAGAAEEVAAVTPS